MDGFVYFIQAEHGGPVKIGWARDPAKRLRELQTGSPHRLVVRATIAGALADEAALHCIRAIEDRLKLKDVLS